MKKIIKLFKNHSPYLVFLTLAEIILATFATISFVYTDKLSYAESEVVQALGVEKLLESMYSSTWWALILLLLSFIAIFSLATMVYKKMDYLFLSISCWVVMLVLAINLNNTMIDNLSIMMIGVPIILINSIAYKSEKEILTKKKKEKTEEKISKYDCIGYSIMVILILTILIFLVYQFRQDKKEIDNKEETTTKEVVSTTTTSTTTKVKNKKATK